MKGKPKYIFIGGAGRSGTTLVQKILLGHPKIGGGPELYFTKSIFELLEKMQEAHQSNCFHPTISKENLKEMIVQFYDGLLLPHAKEDTAYISEKTPTNVQVAQTLLSTYPDAIFIHVYRDGRAVLNSHFKVKKRANEQGKNLTEISLKKTSLYWNNSVAVGMAAKKIHADRVILLSYEELIQQPQKVLNEVFENLGLPAYDGMLQPDKIKLDEKESKAHINNIWYTEEMYASSFDQSKLMAWKKELSLFQQFWASAIMCDNLKSLGYPVRRSHKTASNLFYFFYNFKAFVKSHSIFYPILSLKRKLF